MPIDILTGKNFRPKFEGQRTEVDLEAIMAEGNLTAEEAVAQILEGRYSGNSYWATTDEQMTEGGRPGQPTPMTREIESVVSALKGGSSGETDFLRTESGFENWRASDETGSPSEKIRLFDEQRAADFAANPAKWGGVAPTPYSTARLYREPNRPGPVSGVGPDDPTPAAKPPGDWDTNTDTGAFEDENFFDDEAVEVVTEKGIPRISEIELAQARNLLEAELRMAGFDSAAIGRLLEDWIIPRLTGTYFHEETGVTMEPPENAIDLLPELYEQPVFKDRFPGYHPRMDAGYNVINVQDYLTYEDKFHELMVQYGLDILIEDSGKSSREYIGNLISGNISLTQLGARITQGVSAVLDAPPEVLDQYEDWYGAEGENALLATYLDPNRDLIDLADKAGTAIAGGYAQRVLGEQIELDTAQEIADLDYTNNQLFSAYSALAQQTALFAERAGEEDFDISREGVDYALNLDTDVVKRVQQRRERRAGDFGGGGGALMSTQGTGFGATNA